MLPLDRIRDVAVSTASTSFYVFAPKRIVAALPAGGPVASARRMAAVPGDVRNGVRRLTAAVAAIPELVAEARFVLDGLLMLVRRLDGVCTEAAATVDGARRSERRLATLLEQLDPLLDSLTTLDANAPTRADALLARSGPLLDQIDTVLMPLLGELHEALPDVRDILPIVQRLEPVMVDFETRFAGLPGSARMLRRGAQVIEDARSDDDTPLADDVDGDREPT